MILKDLIADVNVNEIYEHIETETLSEWVNAWQKAALAALRPVSREQVERLWPGCDRCKAADTAIAWERWGHQYCSQCGRPLTPEAWEELRKRLEALNNDKNEFIALIGQDVVVDYPFGRELQRWSMKNFYIDGNGEVKHNRLTLIMDAFIANARNPHKGKPTHG